MKALQSLDDYSFQLLHSSSAITVSEKDSLKVKEILIKAIEDGTIQIKNSI
ncbi:MAG TPA: hypothetical protein PLJ21_13190 [Pseudobdellovibrionaceae bacterium]|nr:hypothetical protein [Pseudobdellovibrionaceae bacterium]